MTARDVFGIVGTTQAGNFHVERVVAEGGFGVVYRAQHGAFRAPVALKCLKIPEEMTKQARSIFLEKFREEAELMFRLSAAITEVVRPLHVDVLHLSDGRFVPFLALEWLEGESLDGIITRRRTGGQAPLGLHKVVKMMRPIAGALSRAHHFPAPQGAVSIIHRDLKPENIFVANIGGNETMKILDFGIAKAKRAATQAVGRVTGQRIAEDEMASFTPAYGAPEQWTPKTYGETGPWTDVWGLALCMVEALAGTPPIDGDTYVMRRACLDDKRRPTPRASGADVPIEVDRVFERALTVDPRKRFKEIEAFWTELEGAMGLPPSFGRRDDRREPGEPSKESAAASSKQERTSSTGASSARLAKIELAKLPAAPVSVRTEEAAPSRRKPEPAPASAPVSSAKAAPRKAPVQEDWSSLGLGDDAPPSEPRAGHRSGLRPDEPGSAPNPGPRPSEPGSVPASAGRYQGGGGQRPEAPASRKISAGYEFDLPTAGAGDASNPPPGRAPENLGPPPAVMTAAGPPGPRARPPMRQPSSMDLEMSLPIHDGAEGPPPAGGGYGPAPQQAQAPPQPYPAPMQTPPVLHVPAPDPRTSQQRPVEDAGPRSNPSGELELLLPAYHQDEAPASPANVGRMTGLATPAVRPPSVAPPGGGDLDFELGIPALKAPPAGLAPIGTAGLPPPAGLMPVAEPPPRERRIEAPEPPAHEMSAGQRLVAPLAILLTSLLVAGADIVFQKATGEHLMLGPVRPFWIAAPLTLFGVGFTLWRLVGTQRDDDA